jgi:propionyl-CoA carboxylase beta chain
MVVGVVANQPCADGRCARYQRLDQSGAVFPLLRRFNSPLVTFETCLALCRRGAGHGGIIRHGAKLIYAYGEATVPKLTVILRKATAARTS